MPAADGLELSLPARADNVAVVRHAVAGLAETLGMEPAGVADLKTILTEACMNVAVHAYGGEAGPLDVKVTSDEWGLTIIVRDQGSGIRPLPDLDESRLRLGLPLIAALSTSFSIRGGLGRGTEVEMRMDLSASPTSFEEPDEDAPVPAAPDAAEIRVGDDRMVAPVISRVLAMLAARSDFPVDRLSDTMLIGDAIAAYAGSGFDEGPVQLSIQDGDGSIDIRLGPMVEGAGEQLRSDLAIPGLDATLEKLADEVTVERDADGEYFTLRLSLPEEQD